MEISVPLKQNINKAETLAVPERNYLYRTLRGLFRLSTKVYFKSIFIQYRKEIPKNVPLILVSNHPSAFMDPILLGTLVPQECVFLARGEAFKKKLGSIMMHKFNALPVYRDDVSPEKVHLNRDTFRKSFRLLNHGKTLFFFPEGISQTEPRLRPLKKGLARLAFYHAEENNWKQELCLLPVGLSYTDPHSFRSKVNVQFGEPVYIRSWKNAFDENKAKATNAFTDYFRQRLEEQTIFIPDAEDEQLGRQAEALFGFWEENNSTSALQQINRFNKAFHQLKVANLQEADALKAEASKYFATLKNLGIEDSDLGSFSTKSYWPNLAGFIAGTLVGLPFFIYGAINHILPYSIAGIATKKMTPRADFTGSLRLAAGSFGTILCYLIQTAIVGSFSSSLPLALIYLLTLPPSGLLALYYAEWLVKMKQTLYLHKLENASAGKLEGLREQRKKLLEKMLSYL